MQRHFQRMEHEFGSQILSQPDSPCWLPSDAMAVQTGMPELNRELGLPGLPRGHIVELLGPEHSGKSTLALRLIAAAQAAGATVALIDAAHQLDAHTAFALGVRGENLLLSHPSDAEQALGITEVLVRSNVVDFIVIDAVSALVPRMELARLTADYTQAGTALVLLRAMYRLKPKLSRSGCCLLFVDQLRDRDEHPFGLPETLLSTRTLNPFTSIRMVLRREQMCAITGDGPSAMARLSIRKNRLGLMGGCLTIPWVAMPECC